MAKLAKARSLAPTSSDQDLQQSLANIKKLEAMLSERLARIEQAEGRLRRIKKSPAKADRAQVRRR